MTPERIQEIAASIGRTLDGALEHARKTPKQTSITEPVFAVGKINGVPVQHVPWGPFKDADAAADYFEAKRKQHGPRLNRSPDAEMMCHDGFDADIISAREFYVRHAAQVIMTAMTLLVELTKEDVGEPMRELNPVSRIIS